MNTNIKKLIMALGASLAFTLSATAFATEFTDMPEGDKGIAMSAAVENGLLNGYDTENGKEIRPDGNITRAEMGTILVRAMGAAKTEDISAFVDMEPSLWHYDYMSKAVAMGAFKGDTENKLNPENNITFQEAFIVLSRIFDLADRKSDDTSDPFTGYLDTDLVADWAKEDVGLILKYGYWTAPDGYLRPTEYITRAEFATVMHNLVKTYIDEEDLKTEEITVEVTSEDGTVTTETQTVKYVSEFTEGNVVIRVSDITIKDFNQTDCDIYICDGISDAVSFENCIANRIVARNGDVRFLSGEAVEIRMLTPKNICYISKTAKVSYLDAAGCTLEVDPIEL